MELKENIDTIIRQTVQTIVEMSAKCISQHKTFSDIISSTQLSLNELGCRVIEQVVDEIERGFDAERNKHQIIVRNRQNTRTLLTSIGAVKIRHTLYLDKLVNRYFFAVDELLQIEKYSRIENNLQSKLVSDATLTSYGKASAQANNAVSRQTVFNLVKKLNTIEAPLIKTNREIKDIYIEADEDHIHLNDGNAAEMKLVYVHEGRETIKNRTILKNPRYFVSIENDSDKIWNDVENYLLENYRVYHSRVHISGDGAIWIKAGMRIMPHVEYHLDKFHLQKALTNISRGNKIIQSQLRQSVYSGKKDAFLSTSMSVCDTIKDTNLRRTIQNNMLYIRRNLPYISRENKCCAEGHVSHVLSARLSSRPMAWSKAGAERMAKLRAFMYNNGNFEKLIREGKKPIILSKQINSTPYAYSNILSDGIKGAYDIPTYSLSESAYVGGFITQKIKKVIN